MAAATGKRERMKRVLLVTSAVVVGVITSTGVASAGEPANQGCYGESISVLAANQAEPGGFGAGVVGFAQAPDVCKRCRRATCPTTSCRTPATTDVPDRRSPPPRSDLTLCVSDQARVAPDRSHGTPAESVNGHLLRAWSQRSYVPLSVPLAIAASWMRPRTSPGSAPSAEPVGSPSA
jgi:hypothetical protein